MGNSKVNISLRSHAENLYDLFHIYFMYLQKANQGINGVLKCNHFMGILAWMSKLPGYYGVICYLIWNSGTVVRAFYVALSGNLHVLM